MNARALLALVLMVGLAPAGRAAAQGVGVGAPPYVEPQAPPLGPREPSPEARPPEGGRSPVSLSGGSQLPRRGKLVMLSRKRKG